MKKKACQSIQVVMLIRTIFQKSDCVCKPTWGLRWWLTGEGSTCRCKRHRSDPWSERIPRATEQLSLRTVTVEPVLQSLGATAALCPRAGAPQQERPEATTMRSLCIATRGQPPLATNRGKPHTAMKTQHCHKERKKIKKNKNKKTQPGRSGKV